VEDGILSFKEDDRTVADYTCFLDIVDWYPSRATQGITLRILKPQEAASPDAIEISTLLASALAAGFLS
jgi:hypothetical protein